ncbi:MAG: extracellular solute-binding protein, partial [Rhodopseudomonas palustris]|nr:extracellular solute-binding protein [Rhodopseudomonas palustris]
PDRPRRRAPRRDVFAMDGPLFPDYQSRGVLLDLKPYIDRDALRPDPARRPGRRRLHDGRRRPVRPAARPQHGRPLLQQGDVRRGRASPTRTTPGTGTKLVEVGKQLTKDARRRRHRRPVGLLHRDDRHGELLALARLAERRRHHERRTRPTTLLGTPEAAGGIQFLQDLIWKQKVMAEPALFAETGDAFEQGKAAMESNGSWLVPTHTAAAGSSASRSASPRCRRARPAGSPRSTRPAPSSTRARKAPDAAWEFVKYLASPAAQEQLMLLKASLPVSKEVLAGPYADVVRGRRRPRRQPRLREAQAVVRRLQRVHDHPPGRARRERLQRAQQDRRPGPADIVPELDAILAAR